MAIQFDCSEASGCPSYFQWLAGKVIWIRNSEWKIEPASVLTESDSSIAAQGFGPYIKLLGFLYGYDFVSEVEEDTIRATDAMELRRRFGEEMGERFKKSERDIDRIWKSIHGKCSVLELLVQLCIRMDAMVNEDGEPESMVPLFFCIMIGNMGLNVEETEAEWQDSVGRFLGRTYAEDGSGGGLFPIENWVEGSSKDQREVPVWYQMNTWMREHLDEEEHFRVEDFSPKHCEQ